jgi:hypothetical protein
MADDRLGSRGASWRSVFGPAETRWRSRWTRRASPESSIAKHPPLALPLASPISIGHGRDRRPASPRSALHSPSVPPNVLA